MAFRPVGKPLALAGLIWIYRKAKGPPGKATPSKTPCSGRVGDKRLCASILHTPLPRQGVSGGSASCLRGLLPLLSPCQEQTQLTPGAHPERGVHTRGSKRETTRGGTYPSDPGELEQATRKPEPSMPATSGPQRGGGKPPPSMGTAGQAGVATGYQSHSGYTRVAEAREYWDYHRQPPLLRQAG